jgi:hypothetical protein
MYRSPGGPVPSVSPLPGGEDIGRDPGRRGKLRFDQLGRTKLRIDGQEEFVGRRRAGMGVPEVRARLGGGVRFSRVRSVDGRCDI